MKSGVIAGYRDSARVLCSVGDVSVGLIIVVFVKSTHR